MRGFELLGGVSISLRGGLSMVVNGGGANGASFLLYLRGFVNDTTAEGAFAFRSLGYRVGSSLLGVIRNGRTGSADVNVTLGVFVRCSRGSSLRGVNSGIVVSLSPTGGIIILTFRCGTAASSIRGLVRSFGGVGTGGTRRGGLRGALFRCLGSRRDGCFSVSHHDLHFSLSAGTRSRGAFMSLSARGVGVSGVVGFG